MAGDVDIVIALLGLTQEQGMKSREVSFTRYDLLRIMGWGYKGRNYGRVKEGLDRLTGMTIKAEHAFYDKEKQAYLTRSFHIIDDYDLWDRAKADESAGTDRIPLKSIVTWNQHIFKSLTAGYVKRLDAERFFRLATPVAKQLFRYLDKKFYRDRCFQIDIFKLCHEHLGISRACKHVSKLKERLTPAMEELVRDGYLESYHYLRSATNRRSLTVQCFKAATSQRPPDSQTPAAYFYEQLHEKAHVERGISEKERGLAESFTRRHGPDTFREFIDFVMREKARQWPDLATLTGAFNAFEDPFLERLEDRQKRQQEAQRERRQRATEQTLRDGYAAYLRSLVAKMRDEHSESFAEFEASLTRLPEYQRCLSDLKRHGSQAGPLSKAASQAAEAERCKLFNRQFAEMFREQGVSDFESWKECHGAEILETSPIL